MKDSAPPLNEDFESNDDDEDDAVKVHLQYERSKELQQAHGSSRYRQTKHIACTTNMVERLFSREKIAMTDLRRSMTPRHLQMIMF